MGLSINYNCAYTLPFGGTITPNKTKVPNPAS